MLKGWYPPHKNASEEMDCSLNPNQQYCQCADSVLDTNTICVKCANGQVCACPTCASCVWDAASQAAPAACSEDLSDPKLIAGVLAKQQEYPIKPEPDVSSSSWRDSPLPFSMCVQACNAWVACARCHNNQSGVRDNICFVYTNPAERLSAVHFRTGATTRTLMSAFPGFFLHRVRLYPGDLVARTGEYNFLHHNAEYEILPSGLGGMPPKSAPKKVKKVVKKAAKAVNKVAHMAQAMKGKAKVHGKGDFFGDVFKAGRSLLGQGLSKGADYLHKQAKSLISKVTGQGDYEFNETKMNHVPIQHNTMYTPSFTVPQFANSADHGTVVSGCEPMRTIVSSVGFNRTTIAFNPGLPDFPWLSRISPAWQRWKPRGVIAMYVPKVTQLNANGGGQVVLSARYDLTTAAPQSIQEAQIAFGAVPGMPWERSAMAIECKSSLQPTNVLNIRFGDLPSGSTEAFFDHCFFDVCTQGQAAAGVELGQLFIAYEIELLMPTAEHITNSAVLTFDAYGAVSTANPHGASGAWAVRSNSTLRAALTSNGASVTLDLDDVEPLPIGSTWLVTYSTAAVGGNITTNTGWSFGTNLGAYTPVLKTSAGADVSFLASGVSSLTEQATFAFQVTGATGFQQIVFSGLVLAAGATGYASLIITPILSTLSESEKMMRRRYPKLYELQDALAEMRCFKSSIPQMIVDTETALRHRKFNSLDEEKIPEPCSSSSSDEETSLVDVEPLPSKAVGVHIDLTRSQFQEFLATNKLPAEPLLSRKAA